MTTETKSTNVEKKTLWQKISDIKISGVSLPVYTLLIIVLAITIALGKLPNNIVGAIAVLVLLGNLFHYLGTKIPIIRSYLGGGAVFTIFASAALATFGILPKAALATTTNFVNNGFLDFYIAALITGAILGMDRNLLLKASVRFIPVALISMLAAGLSVGLMGMILGKGFGDSILYVSLPMMAGGIGAGVVPLSGIYAHVLGNSAAENISRLIPASALGNVFAIIGAALVAKLGEKTPKWNGHGVLMDVDMGSEKKEPVKLDIQRIGVGMMLALTFFMIGAIGNYFVPKIHAYAFMIIVVFICKVTNTLPKSYEESAVMFNQLIVKNLTAAVLAGIGIALLNLNVLASALTWQFVVLCLTSIIVISVVAGVVGKMFGLYPVESVITAGLCNNSMGGTGNVAVLSAANRMELIAFAQMGNRLGGALILIISGFLVQLFS